VSPAESILEDVNAFHAATDAVRRQAAAALAQILGDPWVAEDPDPAEDSLPLLHRPTGLRFVAVPGGSFEMGLSDADLEEASEHVDWTAHVAATVLRLSSAARPVHPVHVRPFLCTRRLLDLPDVARLGAGRLETASPERAAARALAAALGLRLPSEAELEWLARDGGIARFTLDVAARPEQVSRFGVEQLFYGEWAEDDWHPSYEGAPAESVPWLEGEPGGVYRCGYPPEQMQSTDEMLFALAGVRGQGAGASLPSFVGVRLAVTVPG
jgi:formylglycine-generating enzyme required for sulfatase activity